MGEAKNIYFTCLKYQFHPLTGAQRVSPISSMSFPFPQLPTEPTNDEQSQEVEAGDTKKPCRACTDFKSWVKMNKTSSRSKEEQSVPKVFNFEAIADSTTTSIGVVGGRRTIATTTPAPRDLQHSHTRRKT